MSSEQINSNEGAGDSSDEDENSAEEVAATEETKRRFDPEALALDGPSRGEDDAIYVDDMYGDWFLDYASYVILERAVPHADDGLKPVQRRILHSMKELEDGRYNKVANIIGNTMKYHPHGDASIGDAIIQIGQKDLLIDTQGNWGNVLTGDSAAAPRYIEARLTPFALEVIFAPRLPLGHLPMTEEIKNLSRSPPSFLCFSPREPKELPSAYLPRSYLIISSKLSMR